MGHIQDMTSKQKRDFITHKLARAKEERKGNSFEWFNYEKHQKLINSKGYKWFVFDDKKEYTYSQLEAKEIVSELRVDNSFARIVCGMEQCQQRIKSFSIIYKSK